MAAGINTVLNVALPRFGGELEMATHTFKAALCTSDQVLDEGFTGTSGEALYSDLTAELPTGDGYTAGGVTLANVTWALDGSFVVWSADSASWTTLTAASIKYLVIYDDTLADKPIVTVTDLETTVPTGRVSAGGDFIVNFAGEILRLRRA